MWHAIISLRCQTRSSDVRRDMPSPPLDSTHGRTSSGVACYHRLWAAHMVERRWAWHEITTFGQHTRSNDVGRGMLSSILGSTHGPTTSVVACHHRLWAAQTVERRRAWHAIIAFGQHTRSNDVGSGMPSSPLGSTHCERCRVWHSIIAFGKQTRSNNVGHGVPSSLLDSKHDQTTPGVACHHCL